MRTVRSLLLPLLCLFCVALPATASAQAKYPSKPVHWVVGFAAGGPNDIVARIMGEWLSNHLGQQFVIENRVGSGGMIAANAVINSPPDGYTIMFVAPNNAIGATLYKNLQFVFLRDTAPVAGMMRLTNVMVVPPSLPVKTVAEFIANAKANPGKLSYASSGNGTSVHMSAELFKMMTGVDMVHIPYRGVAPATADLLGGRIQVLFDTLPAAIQNIRAGKIRGLAVTSKKRSDALPDVPAMNEFVPGYEADSFHGISAPNGTPREIVDKLNKEINAALADPKLKARLAELGAEVLIGTPEDYGRYLKGEIERWAKVIEFSGAKAE